MHATLAKFVLYDLNNYEGRIRRLKGIPGTSRYTQLLRYGKKNFLNILNEQSKKKIAHFPNILEYWTKQGHTREEAYSLVKLCQKSRSLRSPAAQKGASEYSQRCIAYWIRKGFSEEDAKKKVSEVQRRKHSAERNEKWQQTLKNKSKDEILKINAKKGHSAQAYMLKGLDLESAIKASNAYYAKRKNYSLSSQAFFSRLDAELGLKDSYYKSKNYEKQFSGKCVDFYDNSTGLVIEYYGDFWHRNPTKYAPEFTAYDKRSDLIWAEDKERIALIMQDQAVKKVIIIWENEVVKNPQEVINNIIMEIRNGN
jgi:hypothetical protein